jgi:hypothetical protein
MSTGSREQAVLRYFRECPDLELAQAILDASAQIVQRREEEAFPPKPKVQRKKRTGPVVVTNAKEVSEEHVDAS